MDEKINLKVERGNLIKCPAFYNKLLGLDNFNCYNIP